MNVTQIITDKFIADINTSGKLPWQKPWKAVRAQSVTGHTYRGINAIMASMFSTDTFFSTFNQAKAKGGMVKRGAKSIPIVFYNWVEKADASGKVKKVPFMRYYNVFGLSQIEALTPEWAKIADTLKAKTTQCDFAPVEACEAIAKACGVTITHGSTIAAYNPHDHAIQMPAPESFVSIEAYYATLFHEITHAMAKAVGVELKPSFGTEVYAKEELIAELGANFLLSYAGIESGNQVKNSTAYFQNWLQVLQNDSTMLISAASQAQKRFDKLMELLGVKEVAPEPEMEEVAA